MQLNVSGQMVHTCPAAMGEAFAAGTIDGPGAFDFKQGEEEEEVVVVNEEGEVGENAG